MFENSSEKGVLNEFLNPILEAFISLERPVARKYGFSSSRIYIFDSDEKIRSKVKKTYSMGSQVENNPLFPILRDIIMPRCTAIGKPFCIEAANGGENWEFDTVKGIEEMFKEGKIMVYDLKKAVADEIINIISPIRNELTVLKKLWDKTHEQKNPISKGPSRWDNFISQLVEKYKHLYPDLKGIKLVGRIRRMHKAGSVWGRMSEKEKKSYEQK